ncbi:MAG: ribbon-helix-helix protein, CopG family [Thioclava sp.]|nr:ribbon-helix-helix protein, CopG family [Thioclava sp.]MBD3803969.1 ribbon-helix-helix protein, CopG family [Thioclava sp.]
MKQHRLVSLRLPLDLIDQLGREARALGLSPAEMARQALRQGLTSDTADDEEASAMLPEMRAVQEALDRASDWLDLQQRLRNAGFVLRAGACGAIGLHDWPANRFLIPLDEVGTSPAELVLRYRAPFPGRAAAPELSVPPAQRMLGMKRPATPVSTALRAYLTKAARDAA